MKPQTQPKTKQMEENYKGPYRTLDGQSSLPIPNRQPKASATAKAAHDFPPRGIGKDSPVRQVSQTEIIDRINTEASRKSIHDLAESQTRATKEAAHTPEPYDESVHPSYPSGNSPLTAPINWQAAAKEAARRYTETAAERDKLLIALKDVDLRCTQARIASEIGNQKNKTEFLLGELERIRNVATAAIRQ